MPGHFLMYQPITLACWRRSALNYSRVGWGDHSNDPEVGDDVSSEDDQHDEDDSTAAEFADAGGGDWGTNHAATGDAGSPLLVLGGDGQ